MAENFTPFPESTYLPTPLPPLTGGVVLDYPPDMLADNALASASNFVITDGIVTQRKGYETLIGTAVTGTPLAVFEFIPFDQSSRIMLATMTDFYYSTGGAWNSRTTTARTGTVSNPVFFTPIRTTTGLPLISVNGVDNPAWWNGSTSASFTVLTTGYVAGCCYTWANHLLLGDVTSTADGRVAARVQWSALGTPSVFTGTASTGTLDLLDGTASRIMTFETLRKNLVAYKEKGCHALFYKGSPFYFTQAMLHGELTLLSRKSVASIRNGDQHLVVSTDHILLWDGQNIDFVDDPIRRHFFAELNWNARETVWAMYDPFEDRVLVAIPTGAATTPDKVWIYDLKYNSWWPQDFDLTCMASIFKIWNPPRLLAGHAANLKVYHLFSGLGDGTGATAVVSSLQTKLYDFGASPVHKGVKQVTALLGPGTADTSTVTISKAGTENPLATLSFDAGNTLTVTGATKETKVDSRITNKYLSFRLTHEAAGETIQAHRLIPYIERRVTQRKERS